MKKLFDEMKEFELYLPSNMQSVELIDAIDESFFEQAKQFKTQNEAVLKRVMKLFTNKVFAKIDQEYNE